MTCPKAMIVVGETLHWDCAGKHVDLAVDALLHRVKSTVTSFPTNRTIGASRSVAITPGVHLYAEIGCIERGEALAGALRAGVISGSYVLSTALPAGDMNSLPLNVSYISSGNIYRNSNTPSQAGLALHSNGTRLGIELFHDGTNARVQFSIDGAQQGTSEIITFADAVRIAATIGNNLAECVLYADAGEMLHLPAGAQPIGAAAMVCIRDVDANAYSPAASTIKYSHPTAYSVDAYKKTATVISNVGNSNFNLGRPARAGGLVYVEFEVEVEPLNARFGLVPAGANTTLTPGGDGASNCCVFRRYGAASDATILQNSVNLGDLGSFTSQVVGLILNTETGDAWACDDGVPFSGDPQAGTGAHFTGIDAAAWPAVWIGYGTSVGRIRIRSHALEQKRRPSFCNAFDGADVLPERRFRDAVKDAPEVTTEVSYAQWKERRQRGAQIGNLDLDNENGRFDLLSRWSLRNQPVVAYGWYRGELVREFTGVVDSIDDPDTSTCRINIGDATGKLDKRIESPIFAIGNPWLVPVIPRIDATAVAADVCQNSFGRFFIYDHAVSVDSLVMDEGDGTIGFSRTVSAPNGLHSVPGLDVVPPIAELAVTNGDFLDFTGSAPNGWTIYANDHGGSASSYDNVDTSVFGMVAGNNGVIASWQAATLQAGKTYAIRMLTDVGAYGGDQDWRVVLEDSAGAFDTAGSYESYDVLTSNPSRGGLTDVIFTPGQDWNGFAIVVGFGTGISLDSVRLYEVMYTRTPQEAFTYLLEHLGGFAASDWQYSAPLAPYAANDIGGRWDNRPAIRAVFGELCDSLLVDYAQDAAGVIRLVWLLPPNEVTEADAEWLGDISAHQVHEYVRRESDGAEALSTRAEFRRNYIVHRDGDVAGSAPISVRQDVTSAHRENQLALTDTDPTAAGALHPFFAHAENAPAMPRLISSSLTTTNLPDNGFSFTTDNRLILLHRCYATVPDFHEIKIDRDLFHPRDLFPGRVIRLTYGRHSLDAGKKLMLTKVVRKLGEDEVKIRVWGN